MKNIIAFCIILSACKIGYAQNVLYGNGGYNIQTFKFSWLNSTDSIARIANYGYRIFKPLSLTALSSGELVDTMLVWDYTDSTIKKRVVPSSGTPSLTSTYIGVGDGSNLLSGSSAYTYDGTTVLQENAAAALLVSSTTASSSTAGAVFTLATKNLPSSGDQLGRFNFISRNGGTDNSIGASLRARATGNWVNGSSMPTALDFLTTGTSTATTKMTIASNGTVGIGNTSPGAWLHIQAGTSVVPTARFAPGTLTTTITQGNWEIDATGKIFYSPTTGAGNREQVLYADSVGAIPNGMIFQGNSTHVTGLALGSANQQLRVNAGATALEYFTPVDVTATIRDSTGYYTVTGTTTDATPTTIAIIAPPTGYACDIEATAVGIVNDGDQMCHSVRNRGFIRSSGGTLFQTGTTVIVADQYTGIGGLSAATFDIINAGSETIGIQVTGEAATTILWKVRYRILTNNVSF